MKKTKLPIIRWIILAISALLINSYISGWLYKPHLYTGKLKAIILPVLNCYACPGAFPSCPIGTIQHFMVIKFVPLLTLGILIILGALVGRLFCGWACPFGLFQELLHKIPTPKLSMPRWMRFGKYLFLIITVFVVPYIITDTFFCKLCPQGALEGGIPQMLLKPELRHLAGWLYWTKIAILTITIFLVIFIKRFFCRAICPLGAFLAIFNKISIVQMKVNISQCTQCKLCKKVCPVDINIYEDPNSPECIRCGLCIGCLNGVKYSTIFSSEPTVKPQQIEQNPPKIPEINNCD
ncbi:hypothetical protein DRQ33_01735 [bacterium]|nr:MAG: hypothetical protein DRQ33_01735 [bacterium]